MMFILHRSMQNQSLLSLFQTRTIAEAHRLDEGLITPTSNITWGCLQTSSCMDWEIGQYLSWNGHEFGSNLISCFMIEVSPRSKSCQENMSVNYNNKSAASLQSSGDHNAHPDRSICSSMVPSGAGTSVLVSAGVQLRSSPQSRKGRGLGQFSSFGMAAPISKHPVGVTSAYMAGTSLVACVWHMTLQMGITTLFKVRFHKQILTLLEQGLK